MSTTDTIRAAFVAAKAKMIRTGEGWTDFEMFEAGHKAATEAAKATGTAGELPPLPDPLEINWPELNSNALGCGVEDRGIRDRYDAAEYGWQNGVDKAIERVPEAIYDADQMRAYGQACVAIGRGAAVRDYIENGAEAARQPAPVVDDEAPKRVIDYITAFDKRLIGRGFDHAQRMEIVGLLVSKETQDAALAATAAPVLSDEQILANETLKYYFGLNGGKGPVSDKGHNIIQAVLTVATRSQP